MTWNDHWQNIKPVRKNVVLFLQLLHHSTLVVMSFAFLFVSTCVHFTQLCCLTTMELTHWRRLWAHSVRVEERHGLTTGSDGRFVFEKDQRWGFSAGSWLQTVWRLKVCIDQPVFFSLRHFRPPRCYSSHSEGCKVSAPHLSSCLPPPHLGLYFPW